VEWGRQKLVMPPGWPDSDTVDTVPVPVHPDTTERAGMLVVIRADTRIAASARITLFFL